MGFWKQIFGWKSGNRHSGPELVFGRFTDAYKTDEQNALFDQAIELFEKGEYLASYRAYLSSLKGAQYNNIVLEERDDAIYFEFWQGSQRITGMANAEKLKAQSRIVLAEELNVALLRRLIAFNFNLKFSRFALAPDNCLTILFDTGTVDGSPLKVNFALRELAVHADKQDDLLLDEFKDILKPAEKRVFGEIEDSEKSAKHQYLINAIQFVFAEIDKGKPDPNQFPGAYAYLLLALAFKLDYLVRPEGATMDALERIHGLYFNKSDRTPQLKILHIRKEFQQLLDRPKDTFYGELYRTLSTFGVNPPVNHAALATLIDGEMPNMEWPLQNNYHHLALAVPQYIAGFSLFHYAVPKPDRDLFHLFFEITEHPFFKSLGFTEAYTDEQGRLDKRAILAAIKRIQDNNRRQFPYFRPDVNKLDFGSMVLFAKSFMFMVRELNLSKTE